MGYMMNSVQLEGRLTADPELRYTQGESSFATMRFRLASDNGKDRNGNEKPAAFVTCSATGKTAELIDQYCRKGDTILIEGRIDAGSYTDRNGATQYYTQVDVSRVYFVNVTGKDEKMAARVRGSRGAPAADSSRQQARHGQQDGRAPAGQPGGRQGGSGGTSGQGSRQGQQGRQSGQSSGADDWNGYDEPPFY